MQTNFHNALTRVIQFVCTHRRSYETTSFKKEQSIAIGILYSKRGKIFNAFIFGANGFEGVKV